LLFCIYNDEYIGNIKFIRKLSKKFPRMTRGVIGGVYNVIKICVMDYENYDIKQLMREKVFQT
jgi:hypothetical protein